MNSKISATQAKKDVRYWTLRMQSDNYDEFSEDGIFIREKVYFLNSIILSKRNKEQK